MMCFENKDDKGQASYYLLSVYSKKRAAQKRLKACTRCLPNTYTNYNNYNTKQNRYNIHIRA